MNDLPQKGLIVLYVRNCFMDVVVTAYTYTNAIIDKGK